MKLPVHYFFEHVTFDIPFLVRLEAIGLNEIQDLCLIFS